MTAINVDDFYPVDGDESLELSFELGKDKYVKRPNNYQVIFSYKYLNIRCVDEYCFHHHEFDIDDYHVYFQRVQEYSSHTIDELVEEFRKHNFRVSNAGRKDKKLLEDVTGIKNLKPENTPEVGHFHLNEVQNIKEGTNGIDKRPVIHFFLGPNGVIHVLCYDPFHSVHETNHH